MDIKSLDGMTTNERLFASGKLQDFDKAIGQGDTNKVRSILEEVGIDEASILVILNDLHKTQEH